jgi:hypothetical protein
MRARFLLLAFGTATVIAVGCTNDFDKFNFGGGGAGPTTTTTSSTGGGGMGGGGTGGTAPECMMPSDCPITDGECNDVSCIDNKCKNANKSPGVDCMENGGNVCDGFGLCVECLQASDCPDPEATCLNKACVSPTCMDSVMNSNETDTDCGGPDCNACANGMMCLVPTDCTSGFCDNGTCAACADDPDCAPLADTWCDAGVCSPQIADGMPCTVAQECLSGSCPAQDGVCCDLPCAGTCEACLLADTNVADGTCAPVKPNVDPENECTTALGNCNGSFCSGNAAACQPAPMNTICRPPTDLCDAQEICDGMSTACPNDALVMNGIPCHPTTGPCDPQETCNGMVATCPADLLVPDGGASIGNACNPYLCDGMSGMCPMSCMGPADCVMPATCVGMTCQ